MGWNLKKGFKNFKRKVGNTRKKIANNPISNTIHGIGEGIVDGIGGIFGAKNLGKKVGGLGDQLQNASWKWTGVKVRNVRGKKSNKNDKLGGLESFNLDSLDGGSSALSSHSSGNSASKVDQTSNTVTKAGIVGLGLKLLGII